MPEYPDAVKIWIVRKGQQVTIGEVRGDTFYKEIRGSIHLLETPPMICSDVEALEQAQRAGAQWMEVLDTESGVSYRVHIPRIWEMGIRLDRGHNPQIGLLLGYWQDDRPKPGVLPGFEEA